jgi:hypothetical protein
MPHTRATVNLECWKYHLFGFLATPFLLKHTTLRCRRTVLQLPLHIFVLMYIWTICDCVRAGLCYPKVMILLATANLLTDIFSASYTGSSRTCFLLIWTVADFSWYFLPAESNHFVHLPNSPSQYPVTANDGSQPANRIVHR